jgi:hypothetical protein
LTGFVFDYADYKQADNYITKIKRTAEYVGAEYKHGGYIRFTIKNEVAMHIPLPTEPT